MGLLTRTKEHELTGLDGERVHVDGMILAPSTIASGTETRVKIVKRESDFAADRGVTLRVGEPIPGLKKWRLVKIERRRYGDDVPAPKLVRLTIART